MIERINHALVAFYCALRSLLNTRVTAPARGLGMLEYALMALMVVAVFGAVAAVFPEFIGGIFDRTESEYKKINPGGNQTGG